MKIYPLVLSIVMLGCTGSEEKYEVDTYFNSEQVAATVDSALAQYLLESYMKGDANDAEKNDIIKRSLESIEREVDSNFGQITKATSYDFSSILFAKTLLENENNQKAHRLYSEWFERFNSGRIDDSTLDSYFGTNSIVLFVPGWLYQSDTTTGADFSRQRKLLSDHGINNVLIETGENSTVEENARFIVSEIIDYSLKFEKIILVSASKGGPETALSLHMLEEKSIDHRVVSWVNVGGLLKGTVLADKADAFPWSWFAKHIVLKGRSLDGVRSLMTNTRRTRAETIGSIDSVTVLNYVAIPLQSQVSDAATMGFNVMKESGPNDGLTYAQDAIQQGSMAATIVAFGLDHYYKHDHIDLVTLSLALASVQLSQSSRVPTKSRRVQNHGS